MWLRCKSLFNRVNLNNLHDVWIVGGHVCVSMRMVDKLRGEVGNDASYIATENVRVVAAAMMMSTIH